MHLVKAHAYGNDFVYTESSAFDAPEWPAVARALCARHTGVGADGLILFRPDAGGAVMRLYNADGSLSEVSGNGVRGLAALLAWRGLVPGTPGATPVTITSDAGPKRLWLLARDGAAFTFRAAMGEPTEIREVTLDVDGERVRAVVLRVGNPQCVVLEPVLSEDRYRRLGPQLESHPFFPNRTNVEFACVEAPDRVRILIWERGVGPTEASGTGACASAVAAMMAGGAARDVDVVSPGGTQKVEWLTDGLYLTGIATVVWEGTWIP